VGSIQHMVFQDFDEGPYYLPPNLQQIRKHDEVRGKKVKNRLKKDLSEDIEKLGISTRGKTLKEMQEIASSRNIPLTIEEDDVVEGWLGKPKGLRQILWERGLLDPSVQYVAKIKKDDPNEGGKVEYSSVLNNCTDFMTEKTCLMYLVERLDVEVDRSTKCHPELAGEGIESTILQLLAIVTLLVFYIQEQSAARLNGIMPVTTRLKSLFLTQSTTESSKITSLSTSSSIESLGAGNLLTNSSIESSKVTSTSKQLSSKFSCIDITPSVNTLLPAPNIGISSDSPEEFQNFNFRKSEFQNSLVVLPNADLHFENHNFLPEVNVMMESDYEENDKTLPPSMVDITKLITSLSQQISNQSNFIQDQLLKQQCILEHQAQNDMKLQDVL